MRLFLSLILLSALLSEPVKAGSMSFIIGPPSLGQGGSNPVNIPPFSPVDWQFAYVTAENEEWVISLLPGLFWGQRFNYQQFYAALGGGIVVSTEGLGLGADYALGFESQPMFSTVRVQFEYRQIAGFSEAGPAFSYALRLGVSYVL